MYIRIVVIKFNPRPKGRFKNKEYPHKGGKIKNKKLS